MPARTGQQYADGLKAQEREVWLGGERVRDVTTHPGLSGGVRAIARLYDMQHDPHLRDVMTYESPLSSAPVGRSFQMPPTRDALETRSWMMLNWPVSSFICAAYAMTGSPNASPPRTPTSGIASPTTGRVMAPKATAIP